MANEMVTIRAKRDPDHTIEVDKASADALIHRGDWEAVTDDKEANENDGGNTGGRSRARRSGNN